MPTEKVWGGDEYSVKIDGLEAVVKTFRKASAETNKLLQYANKIFAEEVAEKAKARVYPTVNSVSPGPSEPRGPRRSSKGSIGRSKSSIRANATAKGASIVAGGPKALGFFGHEFGGSRGLGGGVSRPRRVSGATGEAGRAAGKRGDVRSRTRQFPRHVDKEGYFLYPAIRAEYPGLAKRWEEILDEVFEEIP